MTARTAKILISVAIAVGAIAMLRYSARGHTSHYLMVDEVTRAPGNWQGEALQVHGFVEAGSVDERIEGQDTLRTFTLEYRGERLLVHHRGPKPDSFRDRAEVVAEGRLEIEQGVVSFAATSLTAKCPSHYEGAGPDHLFDR